MKLLNPFSIRLEKPSFNNVNESSLVFSDGDFKVYKFSHEWYIHTFKNIVIAERCKINKGIFAALKGELKPTNEADLYFLYERPLSAMNEGIKHAKKLNFSIQ